MEINLLVGAFVFGEKVQDGRFKDAVIDATIKSTLSPDEDDVKWFPGVTAINRAYAGTPTGSPLRRLMVDFWTYRGTDTWDRSGLNADFLTDLVGEIFAQREPPFGLHAIDGKASTCSYHQHGNDRTCYIN